MTDETPAIRIDRLDRRVLTVADIGVTTAFYQRVPGMDRQTVTAANVF